MEMPTEDIERLEKEINILVELYQYHKVNLVHEDGMTEGVWVVSSSENDQKIYKESKGGEQYKVRLCNMPLGWGNKVWGDVVIATTRDENNRPEAYLKDNEAI